MSGGHSAHGMHMESAGGSSMGDGMPGLSYLQQMLWAVVGAVILAFATVHLLNYILYRHRLSSAQRNLPTPSKPRSLFFKAYAASTAVVREIANSSLTPIKIRKSTIHFPSLGRVILILSYIIVLLAFCFYKLNPSNQRNYEDIGYRTGFVTICQLPLLFLLAGKNNIIGVLVGSSYERLNWLHRWAARCLLLTATIHMGYWFGNWGRYDYITTKIQNDPITRRGIGAWAVLVWIVFSSMSPIRGWCYEFFVVQHVVSFVAFVAMIYIHTPVEVHVWVWIPVGLFFLDRTIRLFFVVYTNLSIGHNKTRTPTSRLPTWAFKAEFTTLSHHTTRITINDPSFSWKPGQHVFLSCHSILPLQSHPFTIASLPSDRKLEFLIHAQNGGTRGFFRHAERTHGLPVTEPRQPNASLKTVSIEGPYGRMRPLRQFDTVVLFAGSTGATFTVPLLRDLIQHWELHARSGVEGVRSSMYGHPPAASAVRHVHFIWVIKSTDQLSWFSTHLSTAVSSVARLRAAGHEVSLDISIYVTCDASVTSPRSSSPASISSSTLPNPPDISLDGKNEKQQGRELSEDVREIRPSCGPNGTCCCRDTLSLSATSSPPPCTCHTPSPLADSTNKSSSSIPTLTGRPPIRPTIRAALEQALGETAVVVCGPGGLMTSVRDSVVRLSDERAAGRGTGALGVWFWGEGFGY
ncbi:MAG: hypothetical protein M1833_006277 [Piccolia ochrophora]|nr:MAG: hypothetical protein M1833_006277 [Piccolia ochrophora]